MSVIRDLCLGCVQGKGADGYREALIDAEGGARHVNVQAPAAATVEARTRPAGGPARRAGARLPARHEPPERPLPHRLHRHQRRLHRDPGRAPLPHRLPLRRAGRGPGAWATSGSRPGRDMLGDLAGRLRGRAGFEDSHVSVAKHAQARGEARRGSGAGGRRHARGGPARGEGPLRGRRDAGGGRAGRRRLPATCRSAGWRAAPSARWRSPPRGRWWTWGRRDRRSRRSWRPAPPARCRTPCRATSRSRAACWWWSTWAPRSTATARTARARSPPVRSTTTARRGLRAGAARAGGGAGGHPRGRRAVRGRRRGARDHRGGGPRRALRARSRPRRGPRGARGAAGGEDGQRPPRRRATP